MAMTLPRLIGPLLAVALSGCGTVCNLSGAYFNPDKEPRVYGGVIRDVETIGAVVNRSEPIGNSKAVLILLPLAVIDPTLCFVADTLTLPITIPLQARRNAESSVRPGKTEPGGGSSASSQ